MSKENAFQTIRNMDSPRLSGIAPVRITLGNRRSVLHEERPGVTRVDAWEIGDRRLMEKRDFRPGTFSRDLTALIRATWVWDSLRLPIGDLPVPRLVSYEPHTQTVVMEEAQGKPLSAYWNEESRIFALPHGEDRYRIATGVLRGIDYLNQIGVAHCDIHGANIIYNNQDSGSVKLIDFGGAAIAQTDIKDAEIDHVRSDFTPATFFQPNIPQAIHRAPEQGRTTKLDGRAADRYGTAALITNLYFGEKVLRSAGVLYEEGSGEKKTMIDIQLLRQQIENSETYDVATQGALLDALMTNLSFDPWERTVDVRELAELLPVPLGDTPVDFIDIPEASRNLLDVTEELKAVPMDVNLAGLFFPLAARMKLREIYGGDKYRGATIRTEGFSDEVQAVIARHGLEPFTRDGRFLTEVSFENLLEEGSSHKIPAEIYNANITTIKNAIADKGLREALPFIPAFYEAVSGLAPDKGFSRAEFDELSGFQAVVIPTEAHLLSPEDLDKYIERHMLHETFHAPSFRYLTKEYDAEGAYTTRYRGWLTVRVHDGSGKEKLRSGKGLDEALICEQERRVCGQRENYFDAYYHTNEIVLRAAEIIARHELVMAGNTQPSQTIIASMSTRVVDDFIAVKDHQGDLESYMAAREAIAKRFNYAFGDFNAFDTFMDNLDAVASMRGKQYDIDNQRGKMYMRHTMANLARKYHMISPDAFTGEQGQEQVDAFLRELVGITQPYKDGINAARTFVGLETIPEIDVI